MKNDKIEMNKKQSFTHFYVNYVGYISLIVKYLNKKIE